jgi:hypothetical protein
MERVAGASLLSKIRIAFRVTPPPPVPACGSSRSLTDLVHHCASANDFELLIVVSEYRYARAVLCSMTLILRLARPRRARPGERPIHRIIFVSTLVATSGSERATFLFIGIRSLCDRDQQTDFSRCSYLTHRRSSPLLRRPFPLSLWQSAGM